MIYEEILKKTSLKGNDTSLEALLDAREKRAHLQQYYLRKYQTTILSFTLLAVGGVKKNPLLDTVFEKGLECLAALFSKLNIAPIFQNIHFLETGHEALFVLPINAQDLKQEAIKLEDSSPLSRLWDIDVFDKSGELLSRSAMGFSPRNCLICNGNAKRCARTRKHSLDEILSEMQRRVSQQCFSESVAEIATAALLEEARLSPKPGLVDSRNNGAHQDMDLQTFERSAKALKPYFTQFMQEGAQNIHLNNSQLLNRIRPVGLKAEQAMFQATGNVNTHKGSIFSFGLVCCAIGRISAQIDLFEVEDYSKINIKNICQIVAEIAQGITAELQNYPKDLPLTAGVKLYQKFGITGARGEAEDGFKLIQKHYSIFNKFSHLSNEHRQLILLLHIIAENPDTNVLHRGGLEGLDFMQQRARALLENPAIFENISFLKQQLIEFDKICITKNLSAGGSADLLALSIFFHLLEYSILLISRG